MRGWVLAKTLGTLPSNRPCVTYGHLGVLTILIDSKEILKTTTCTFDNNYMHQSINLVSLMRSYHHSEIGNT